MIQRFHAENWLHDEIPWGGVVKLITAHPTDKAQSGTLGEYALNNPALYIRWQEGPLVAPDGSRYEANGCFVETVIEAALQRMEFYQETRFACEENQEIIDHLRKAIAWCQERTARREARQVEGTSQV
jgi:hypothetical protein